jgi:hypothetical protein
MVFREFIEDSFLIEAVLHIINSVRDMNLQSNNMTPAFS